MEFKLNFSVPEAVLQITHKDAIVLLGSCFSDEMSEHFKNSGFNVRSNTFGTLFHPSAIAKVVNASLDDDEQVNIYQREDLFFSWDSAGKIFGNSLEKLTNTVVEKREVLKEQLISAGLLVVTLGTAWGYRHTELDTIVGNCHKAPSTLFQKELSETTVMLDEWKTIIRRLKELNPSLQIVFTVSPVRHKKDGLVENNRSKARLIELTHALTEEAEVHYFPAYEILIDELRDYRFYTDDLVHPSKEAVEYVYEKFKSFALTENAQELSRHVLNVRRSLEHKSLYPGSTADRKRLEDANRKKGKLMLRYPEVFWK